jgi:hypothetical protein
MLKLSLVLLLTAYSLACTVRGENMKQAEPPPDPQHAKLYPITVDDKHGFIDETGNVKFMLPEEVYTTSRFQKVWQLPASQSRILTAVGASLMRQASM